MTPTPKFYAEIPGKASAGPFDEFRDALSCAAAALLASGDGAANVVGIAEVELRLQADPGSPQADALAHARAVQAAAAAAAATTGR